MTSGNRRSYLTAVLLTIFGMLLRLAPHPPNFAPIGATGLFSGARLRGWLAYLVPLVAMIVTDPIRSAMEGHYPSYSSGTVIVYTSLLIYVYLGRRLMQNSQNPFRICLACLLGSIQFFVITNFFVWLGAEDLYPHTFAGLIACYTAAIPFFGRTILSDLFYTAVLTTAYLFITRRFASNERQIENLVAR
jgi:hypothetical protein